MVDFCFLVCLSVLVGFGIKPIWVGLPYLLILNIAASFGFCSFKNLFFFFGFFGGSDIIFSHIRRLVLMLK